MKKPDGSYRLCINYRRLNAATKLIVWPIGRIDETLDKLSSSLWFTSLDLKSGYYEVAMEEESVEKTAFSTPDGHFEFTRLPFGLKNAPAEFTRIMHMILGNLGFVVIYIDDIIVHSHTFSEHLEHLRIVIEKLKKAGLKLNLEKCC